MAAHMMAVMADCGILVITPRVVAVVVALQVLIVMAKQELLALILVEKAVLLVDHPLEMEVEEPIVRQMVPSRAHPTAVAVAVDATIKISPDS